ncbi:uncharacterized protein [Montipora capricornis]|uniref:uncharacterized protein n=1 Tax=Montipora capricornis TaxID=246305 RepID=UPI0035F1BEDD
MEVYYHYTNEAGAKAIGKSKKILEYRGHNHAVFGPGVYLTKIGPENGPLYVLINNYDDFMSMVLAKADRADYVIAIKLPPGKVKKCDDDGRDVYLYKGDLYLKDGEYAIKKLRKDKK